MLRKYAIMFRSIKAVKEAPLSNKNAISDLAAIYSFIFSQSIASPGIMELSFRVT